MRLFTAIWPDEAVNDDVDARLARADLDAGWRAVARERRHVTLRFHGDADPAVLIGRWGAAELRDVAGLRLRCRGAGIFGSALWLGVEADDPARLSALVAAAGGEPEEHVAHLTVARGRGGLPDVPADRPGPWWPITAVDLVAGGTPYRTVARVAVPDR